MNFKDTFLLPILFSAIFSISSFDQAYGQNDDQKQEPTEQTDQPKQKNRSSLFSKIFNSENAPFLIVAGALATLLPVAIILGIKENKRLEKFDPKTQFRRAHELDLEGKTNEAEKVRKYANELLECQKRDARLQKTNPSQIVNISQKNGKRD